MIEKRHNLKSELHNFLLLLIVWGILKGGEKEERGTTKG